MQYDCKYDQLMVKLSQIWPKGSLLEMVITVYLRL